MWQTRKEMSGLRFGQLTVIEYSETRNGQAYWLCKCDCGNKIVARANHLRTGNIKSCGCLRGKVNANRSKHGLSYSRIYNTYYGMVKRCNLPSNASFSRYGGRGIKICDEWLDKSNGFNNFLEWALSHGYSETLTLDRIDVNGNYSPENCRWVTPKVQANNRSSNVIIEYNSESHTMSEWAEITGISQQAIASRLRKGWSVQRTLTQEMRKQKRR